MKRILVAAMALVLAATAQLATVAPAGAAVARVKVSVNCYSNPERLTIKNNRRSKITIKKVGSTYQPRAGEPYTVNRVLRPGKSITFTFGPGAGPNKVTNQYIFSNTAATEKAKIVMNVGTKYKAC